jgi:hypothetical protein
VENAEKMTGKRGNRILIRLAASPQRLAEGFPFQSVHQASPKTAAMAVNSAGTSRLTSRIRVGSTV